MAGKNRLIPKELSTPIFKEASLAMAGFAAIKNFSFGSLSKTDKYNPNGVTLEIVCLYLLMDPIAFLQRQVIVLLSVSGELLSEAPRAMHYFCSFIAW